MKNNSIESLSYLKVKIGKLTKETLNNILSFLESTKEWDAPNKDPYKKFDSESANPDDDNFSWFGIEHVTEIYELQEQQDSFRYPLYDIKYHAFKKFKLKSLEDFNKLIRIEGDYLIIKNENDVIKGLFYILQSGIDSIYCDCYNACVAEEEGDDEQELENWESIKIKYIKSVEQCNELIIALSEYKHVGNLKLTDIKLIENVYAKKDF